MNLLSISEPFTEEQTASSAGPAGRATALGDLASCLGCFLFPQLLDKQVSEDPHSTGENTRGPGRVRDTPLEEQREVAPPTPPMPGR